MFPQVNVPDPTAKVELTAAEGAFIVTVPVPVPTFNECGEVIEIPFATAAEFKVKVLQLYVPFTVIVWPLAMITSSSASGIPSASEPDVKLKAVVVPVLQLADAFDVNTA